MGLRMGSGCLAAALPYSFVTTNLSISGAKVEPLPCHRTNNEHRQICLWDQTHITVRMVREQQVHIHSLGLCLFYENLV